MGRNFGLKFVVDSLVTDAKRMGAKEVAIYKCSYGKPLEFVNFVSEMAGKNGYKEVIKDVPRYKFTAIDAEDDALAISRGDQHHYTDAFGENSRLKGKRNCLVIDVDAYYEICNYSGTYYMREI